MISFRQHVVTLVAVFLALAVGVVLGGGPLTELGRTDTAPASARATAQDREARQLTGFADDFASASAARLYAGGLAGHPVAVLTLPGADEKTVSGLTAQVRAAGGQVGGSYGAQPALVDAGEKSLVDTLGSQLMTQLGAGTVPADASTYDRMGQLMGIAIATTEPASGTITEDGSAIRQSLSGAHLMYATAKSSGLSPLVLVVLGDDTDDSILSGLVAGLAARSVGVVVAGSTATGASGGDLGALRTEPVADQVASVDGVERPLGQVTATLALIRSLTTKGGSFGASGSDGAVPVG